ncbi:MAG: hypothetical protein PHY16_19730 [Methylobacter sp.]|nr:hypothetical protein [Methylobacter sp.]
MSQNDIVLVPLCEAILNDFSASYWLKLALTSALERDPVDAVADAEALVRALREHCDDVVDTVHYWNCFDI